MLHRQVSNLFLEARRGCEPFSRLALRGTVSAVVNVSESMARYSPSPFWKASLGQSSSRSHSRYPRPSFSSSDTLPLASRSQSGTLAIDSRQTCFSHSSTSKYISFILRIRATSLTDSTVCSKSFAVNLPVLALNLACWYAGSWTMPGAGLGSRCAREGSIPSGTMTSVAVATGAIGFVQVTSPVFEFQKYHAGCL